ncbi:MAG TPA: hypothetical protein VFM57_09180 [Thermoleophilaceae bacterium]|nr:hypothetical protein [Thermoleophilaceae bacterium]
MHRVKDARAFSSQGEELGDPSKAPAGVLPRQFCPSNDLTTATCVWEAGSVASVRDYVDTTLEDSSDNTYFEIDSEHAQGLPEPATTPA